MDNEKKVELKCKYCRGPLQPDTPRRDIQADKRFKFYRCEVCHMSNVVEIASDQ